MRSKPPHEPLDVCLDYCRTVTENIEDFLSDKPQKMTIRLENIEEDFKAFWIAIGAEGNQVEALQVFKKKHNASKGFLAREWARLLKLFGRKPH